MCKTENNYLQITVTWKLLLCVGVGLINKTLEWQQISPIPSSENIVKYVKIELFIWLLYFTTLLV